MTAHPRNIDIYGLGNALVDTEYRVEDAFLTTHRIAKGHMTLVEAHDLDALNAALATSEPEHTSGGSAANSLFAAQGFGCATFYSCKVADDATGAHFLHDLGNAGIHVNGNAMAASGTSGQCVILITPDAERTMNTFLGISSTLSKDDIDEDCLAHSAYLYSEGYLSTNEDSRDAFIAARELAVSVGVKTVLSLSDPSIVEFFRVPMGAMLGEGIDHIFCNEEEALTWARTDRLDIAITELRDIARGANITLGAKGSMVISPDTQKLVPGFPVKAIDTNGAGDIYAGACMAGWQMGWSAEQAASFGNFAAAQLVTRYGARLRSIGEYRQVLAAFQAL